MEQWREDILAHYGILGMKWGVRRYQREDGSYTKKGLERYRESSKKYERANSKYKEAKKNKDVSKLSRLKEKRAEEKIKLSNSYGYLKKANKIDRGEKLVKQGKSIFVNKMRDFSALSIAMATGYAAYNVGSSYVKAMRGRVMSKAGLSLVRGSEAVMLGSAIVYAMVHAKYARENSDINAYYNKPREKKNKS